MTSATADRSARYAPIYVERMEIHDFRGIESCALEFEPGLTLLVGRNNVGKSRVLSAMQLALGGRAAEVDDFTVGSTADPAIDVIVSPPPPADDGSEQEFDKDVARKLERGVQSIDDSPFRERFAWRTYVRHSAEGLGARVEYRILTFDVTARTWIERQDAASLSRATRSLWSADLVNTGRDLTEELGRRGSGVSKILSDLEVDAPARQLLEERLVELSASIVSESRALASIERSLAQLNQAIGSAGSPGINAIPVTIEELARALSIELDSGNGKLPIRMHGAGARSLASLQIQGVLYERLLGADGGALRPHPVTLIEEPEAHLHPQAASELPHLLRAVRGQVVASTHSSQVVTASDHKAVRILRKEGAHLAVVDLGPAPSNLPHTPRALRSDTHIEEMEKLKRLAERPFGEMLFASAIIIGDGATERGLLPPLIRHALGPKANGVCVVDPESMTSPIATAAVKFATLVGIPCFVFADSDQKGMEAVDALRESAGGVELPVVWVGSADPGSAHGVSGATEAMMCEFDESVARLACEHVRPDRPVGGDVISTMKQLKGAIGPTLADLTIDKYPDATEWPGPICSLLGMLDGAIK